MLAPRIKGELDVIKEEMARLNDNVLGISELKWTTTGTYHSHGHYIYYFE